MKEKKILEKIQNMSPEELVTHIFQEIESIKTKLKIDEKSILEAKKRILEEQAEYEKYLKNQDENTVDPLTECGIINSAIGFNNPNGAKQIPYNSQEDYPNFTDAIPIRFGFDPTNPQSLLLMLDMMNQLLYTATLAAKWFTTGQKPSWQQSVIDRNGGYNKGAVIRNYENDFGDYQWIDYLSLNNNNIDKKPNMNDIEYGRILNWICVGAWEKIINNNNWATGLLSNIEFQSSSNNAPMGKVWQTFNMPCYGTIGNNLKCVCTVIPEAFGWYITYFSIIALQDFVAALNTESTSTAEIQIVDNSYTNPDILTSTVCPLNVIKYTNDPYLMCDIINEIHIGQSANSGSISLHFPIAPDRFKNLNIKKGQPIATGQIKWRFWFGNENKNYDDKNKSGNI